MTKRDFLTLRDLSLDEARAVLSLATRLKKDRRGTSNGTLGGRSVAIVMEKASTRTRVSFDVGVAELGGHPVIVSADGSQIARGEPVRDTARVLERYCDMIVYRTSTTARLLEMARARVPVINALTDDGHPVQILCDIFTIEEALGRPITGERIAFIGDGSSNMARSWLEAAPLFGFHLAVGAPEGYRPPDAEIARAGTHVSLHGSSTGAVLGAAAVNTDVWTSMGQDDEAIVRRQAFKGWTVDAKLLLGAPPTSIVLHCLPAHRGEEIDDATMEGAQSRVWDQAENRLHVQKALMLWLLGQSRAGS